MTLCNQTTILRASTYPEMAYIGMTHGRGVKSNKNNKQYAAE